MKRPTKIAHPLKGRKGTSQKARASKALQAEYAPVDGKKLADRLFMISEYARHIKYHELASNINGKEYLQADTWTSFFTDSLPFQLALLSKTSTESIEEQFALLYGELQDNPTTHALDMVLAFIYDKTIQAYHSLYQAVSSAENSFQTTLFGILETSFKEQLKQYIALYNASVSFLCAHKKSFLHFQEAPWNYSIEDLFAYDTCIQKVNKGKKKAILMAGARAEDLFLKFILGVDAIISASPDYIEESLIPLEESLQQKHEPHLALLFTFLELFRHLEGEINDLGMEHLDFFYQEVLKIKPKDAVPDKAHLIFEIANHLEAYPLKKDLALKDGKDDNGQDIQFGLDHDLVIDKAQITNLRTLFLKTISDGEHDYIKGIYVAPIANSMDGLGKKFKTNQPKNWSTLGSGKSKSLHEGGVQFEEHPKGRIGFVLSSSVLFLQEGKREITIILDCDVSTVHEELKAAEIAALLIDISDKLYIDDTKTIYCINNQLLETCELSDAANAYLSKLLITTNPYDINASKWTEFVEVKDSITCKPIFSEADKVRLKECLESSKFTKKDEEQALFNAWFSGEEDWIKAVPKVTINDPPTLGESPSGEIQFVLKFTLTADDPAVVFYNEANLEEPLDLKDQFPLVKIEVNPDIRIDCGKLSKERQLCCLSKSFDDVDLLVSPYQFLKNLQLVNAQIDVEVCGVKNLIVQNDENLQDVNKPIMPFGPRPKVGVKWNTDKGSNFYIGSKEVFFKNWQKFWINSTWKDKPDDLHEHYRFYRGDSFENEDFAITDCSFRFVTSFLDQGIWIKDDHNKTKPPSASLIAAGDPSNHWDDNYNSDYVAGEYLALFKNSIEDASTAEEINPCEIDRPIIPNEDRYAHKFKQGYFPSYSYRPKSMPLTELEPLSIRSRKGFVRLTLAGTSFQHERFTYVLARQMMALANLLDPESIELVKNDLELLKKLSSRSKTLMNSILSEVNFVVNHVNAVHDTAILAVLALTQSIEGHLTFINANYDINPVASKARVLQALSEINDIIDEIGTAVLNGTIVEELNHAKGDLIQIKEMIEDNPAGDPNGISDDNVKNNLNPFGLQIILIDMERRIIRVANTLDLANVGGLPIEPYTPLIKSLSIDYKAVAMKDDMEIVHLYPFENTSKREDIELYPMLVPFLNDEGTLFIGIETLTPGNNLSLLFQLAEATADSEADRAELEWHYLSNNEWIELRPEFEVISDDTHGLTVSGIVTIAIPDTISNLNNTVMPEGLYWIKVSALENVKAVAETISIHTQAGRATADLNEVNDKGRLSKPLEAGKISKLVKGDFNVKKIEQPYPSVGGRLPEGDGHFYIRVSEHLKHKGRAQLLEDYEKIVLEGFPEIFKAKCISHTMGLSGNEYRRDLEVAPGFIVVAVIPDLNLLQSGNSLEPKAPVSLLEKISRHLRTTNSPFARLRVMNPRYEPIKVCIEIRFKKGTPENFYAKQLKEDITHFLAPWYLGDTDKLAFGQEIYYSDLVGYVEGLDYVDYIVELELQGPCKQKGLVIYPLTARSILSAGEVCVEVNKEECPDETEHRILLNQ